MHKPQRPTWKALRWLVALAALAGVCVGIFWTRQNVPAPGAAGPPDTPPPVAHTLRPESRRPGITPSAVRQPSARAARQEPALDTARLEVANRALAGLERLFLDPSDLEAVRAGDIRGGMLPASLSGRRIALAAIETVIAQPENRGPVRDQSLRLLEALVRQDWPGVTTPEADQFVLQERGHALASLINADPNVAAAAYRGMPDETARERVALRAVHLLVEGGMDRGDARARVADLSRP